MTSNGCNHRTSWKSENYCSPLVRIRVKTKFYDKSSHFHTAFIASSCSLAMWLALLSSVLLSWILILCGKQKENSSGKKTKPKSKEAVTPTPPVKATVPKEIVIATPTPKPANGSKEAASKEKIVEKVPKEDNKKAEKDVKKSKEAPSAPPPTGPVEEFTFDEQVAFLEERKADLKKNPMQFTGKDSPYQLARRIYKSHECQNLEKDKNETESCRVCAAYVDYSAQTYLCYKRDEEKYRKKDELPGELIEIENDFFDYLGKLPDELVASADYQKSVEWRKEVFASEKME